MSFIDSQDEIVVVQRLNHYFGKGTLRQKALTNINLTLHFGEMVIMTGPSGSGKTTILSLIGGLRSVQEGSVKVLGKELNGATDLQLVQLRRQIGFIFQRMNLVEFLTAQQNVQMTVDLQPKSPRQKVAPSSLKAYQILETVGLSHRCSHYPKQLSGGEQQRTAIACALVNTPKLVLADEPTAFLDRHSGHKVVKLMQQLAREQRCAVLIATHDYRILSIADRQIHIEDGQIINRN
jgi:putative ABC transport system ATP-binding protein